MSIEFGTGGWRAIIGDGFTKANVQRLAAALARKMKDENAAQRGFLAGYDRRFLSKEAAHWAAEVMAGAGVPCMVVEREAPPPSSCSPCATTSCPTAWRSPPATTPPSDRKSVV